MKITGIKLDPHTHQLQKIRSRARQLGASHLKPSQLALAPFIVEVNLLRGQCNAMCVNCFGQRNPSMLKPEAEFADIDMLKIFFQEAKQSGVKQTDFTVEDSEPTLYSNFIEAVRCADANGLIVGIYTNGIQLTDPIIEALMSLRRGAGHFLIFSLCAATRFAYLKHRRVDRYRQVITNLRRLIERKQETSSDLPIKVNYTLIRANSFPAQIEYMIRFSLNMGVDRLRIRYSLPPHYVPFTAYRQSIFAPRASAEQIEALVRHYDQNSGRVVFLNIQEALDYDPQGHCWSQFLRVRLRPDGTLEACCRTGSLIEGRHNGFIIGRYSPGNLASLWQAKTRDAEVDNLCHRCAASDVSFTEDVLKIL